LVYCSTSGDMLIKSFRFWSLAMGALSLLPLAYYIYQYWLFAQWAQERASNGQFVCGTGIVLLLGFCAAVTAAFSGIATLLGFIGYRRIQKPRPGNRLLEVAAVASTLPLLLVTGMIFN